MIKENFLLSSFYKVFHISRELPSEVQVGITNVCNLDCVMCPRNFVNIKIKHMEFKEFKKIIGKVGGVKNIILTGLGEPFSYPKIFGAIKYCKDNNFEVQITTNGHLLNDEKIEKLIELNVDRVTFSIDGVKYSEKGHKGSSLALKNIQRLIGRKKELNSKKPFITLQSVLANPKDVFDVIKWGAKEGVDRINVLRLSLTYDVPGLNRPSMKEEKGIVREFVRLREKYGIRIDFMPDQVYTGFKGWLYKYSKYLLRLDSYCFRFIDFCFITIGGDVQPCSHPEKSSVMGNIHEQSLKEIWRGDRFNFLRKHQNRFICSRCDQYKLKHINGKD